MDGAVERQWRTKHGVDPYEWLGPLAAEIYEILPETTWKLAAEIGLT